MSKNYDDLRQQVLVSVYKAKLIPALNACLAALRKEEPELSLTHAQAAIRKFVLEQTMPQCVKQVSEDEHPDRAGRMEQAFNEVFASWCAKNN